MLSLNFFHLKIFKGHRAQWLNGVMIVAGGISNNMATESCKLNEKYGDFDCVDISPSLSGYTFGSSFAVSANFCV